MVYQLHTSNGIVEVLIIKSKRKSLGLQIKDGKVYARMPLCVSNQECIDFIEKHSQWIERKLMEMKYRKHQEEKKDTSVIPYENLTGEMRSTIQQLFEKETEYWAKVMQVTYGRITIRNQKTRWGSCSSMGNLNFNYRLYFYSKEVREYVIVHELAHRKYMNHSELFWSKVEKYIPDYKKVRKILNKK